MKVLATLASLLLATAPASVYAGVDVCPNLGSWVDEAPLPVPMNDGVSCGLIGSTLVAVSSGFGQVATGQPYAQDLTFTLDLAAPNATWQSTPKDWTTSYFSRGVVSGGAFHVLGFERDMAAPRLWVYENGAWTTNYKLEPNVQGTPMPTLSSAIGATSDGLLVCGGGNGDTTASCMTVAIQHGQAVQTVAQPLPYPLENPCFGGDTTSSALYIAGGKAYDADGGWGKLSKSSLRGNGKTPWVAISAELTWAREQMAGVLVGQNLWCIGGDSVAVDVVNVYSGTTCMGPNLPATSENGCAVTYGGKVYAILGAGSKKFVSITPPAELMQAPTQDQIAAVTVEDAIAAAQQQNSSANGKPTSAGALRTPMLVASSLAFVLAFAAGLV